MKKLLTFALLLMLMACEKNEPNIVIPELNSQMTKLDVIEIIGSPDVSETFFLDTTLASLFIYQCTFAKNFGEYIRIDGDGRYFYVLFENGNVSKFYYSYLSDDVLVLMKNNPPR